jgi:hypothetical protein
MKKWSANKKAAPKFVTAYQYQLLPSIGTKKLSISALRILLPYPYAPSAP